MNTYNTLKKKYINIYIRKNTLKKKNKRASLGLALERTKAVV